MRLVPFALLGLSILAVPVSDATYTTVFTKTYNFNGVFTGQTTTDTFSMPDPGGALPAACYYRGLSGGPAGSILVRVYDAHGDLVFVDAIAGAGFFGLGQPLGLGGFTPGTWRVIVVAHGYIPATSISVRIAAASNPALC